MAEDLGLWHVLMEGPEDTPYEGRWFRLWVKFGEDYPYRPPEVRFVTPVLHVNINHEGRICHGAFGTAYTSDTSAIVLLGEVYRLLAFPLLCYSPLLCYAPLPGLPAARLPLTMLQPLTMVRPLTRSTGCSPSPIRTTLSRRA